jgi:hypothetical protein
MKILVFQKILESKKQNGDSQFIISKIESFDISAYTDFQLSKSFLFYVNRGTRFIIVAEKVGNIRLLFDNNSF